jgi:hypothetical protein
MWEDARVRPFAPILDIQVDGVSKGRMSGGEVRDAV